MYNLYKRYMTVCVGYSVVPFYVTFWVWIEFRWEKSRSESDYSAGDNVCMRVATTRHDV